MKSDDDSHKITAVYGFTKSREKSLDATLTQQVVIVAQS